MVLWKLIHPFVPRPNPFPRVNYAQGRCQAHPQADNTRKWTAVLPGICVAAEYTDPATPGNSFEVSLDISTCTGAISKTQA